MDIKLNYSNVLSDVVGEHGISEQELKDVSEKIAKAHGEILRKKSAGELGFTELPRKTNDVKKLKTFAKKLAGKFENFVVVGIGGSALGNIALQTALRHPYWNLLNKNKRKGWCKLFVPDNVDPELIKGLSEVINFKNTIFNVISKSGTTAEGLANYFVLRKILIQKVGKNYRKNIIITTDAGKGFLREHATKENIISFEVPGNVGGRFSVLSPVGVVSAAFTGINVEKLLSGADVMDKKCSSDNLFENPAAMFAAINYLLYQKGKKICVMFPYSNALYGISDWFRQLWAESLGKKTNNRGETVNIGPTPVKALGATDQHSQIQLYIEGPFDKIITFLSVSRYRTNVRIPKTGYKHYLEGHSLNELIKSEEDATRIALTKEKRPNLTIEIPKIDEENIGGLIYLLELATAYAGELFEINTFDQPGVELGKHLTYGLMGRSGFEERKKEIEEFKSRQTQRII